MRFKDLADGEWFRIPSERFGPSVPCRKLCRDRYRFRNELTGGRRSISFTAEQPINANQEVLRISAEEALTMG